MEAKSIPFDGGSVKIVPPGIFSKDGKDIPYDAGVKIFFEAKNVKIPAKFAASFLRAISEDKDLQKFAEEFEKSNEQKLY